MCDESARAHNSPAFASQDPSFMQQDPPEGPSTGSFIDKLRRKAQANNRNYLTEGHVPQDAALGVINCPQCGAARTCVSELRFCTYCQHEFLSHDLSDGIHLKNNSDPGR
jgi:hypothetical protein